MANLQSDYDRLVAYLGLDRKAFIHIVDYGPDYQGVTMAMERAVIMQNVVFVSLCTAGTMIVSINGLTYSIKAGDVMVLFPKTYYRLISMSTDYAAHALIGRTSEELEIVPTLASYPKIVQQPVISLTGEELDLISSMFAYIRLSCSNTRNIYLENISDKIFMMLCFEIGNIYSKRYASVAIAGRNEQLFQRFLDRLARNYRTNRDVEYYAASFEMTPKRFANKIKAATGLTPSQWISDMVIKNAKTLLETSQFSIAEISEKLNFATPSFFCQYFKRYVKQTPLEWRRDSK